MQVYDENLSQQANVPLSQQSEKIFAVASPKGAAALDNDVSDFEQMVAPPPPPSEEAPTTPNELTTPASALDALLAPVPTLTTPQTHALLAGHALAAFFYLTGATFTGVGAWALLLALIGNGMYTTVKTPKATTTIDVDAIAPHVLDALRSAVTLLGRFQRGEPRLSFGAALGALGLVLSPVSLLGLAYAAYAGATAALVAKAAHSQGKLDGVAAAALTKLTALVDQFDLETKLHAAKAKVPPQATQLAPVVAPLVSFLGWLFFLGYFDKFLTAGLCLLGYKAWSDEANVQLRATVAKAQQSDAVNAIKKASRRMTMGAGELVTRISSSASAKNKEL